MNKRLLNRYRIARRIAIFMAAAPLFQLSQCQTGVNQVLATSINNTPATIFQVLLNFALAPIQFFLFGNTGFGGGGTGTGGFF